MHDSASIFNPIDTVIFENYRYVFAVKGDTNFYRWDLIKKDKLYTDYYKAVSVGLFFESMGELALLPHLTETDKIMHFVAGEIIGGGSSLVFYKITHKKLLSSILGLLTASAIGGLKEVVDPYIGHTRNIKDWGWTSGGGFSGALKIRFILK